MQGNAKAHTANKSVNALAEPVGERRVSQGLWSARSPDLNPCDFHLWGILKDKRVCKQSSFTTRAERKYSTENFRYSKTANWPCV
jgi:hypothetical protein